MDQHFGKPKAAGFSAEDIPDGQTSELLAAMNAGIALGTLPQSKGSALPPPSSEKRSLHDQSHRVVARKAASSFQAIDFTAGLDTLSTRIGWRLGQGGIGMTTSKGDASKASKIMKSKGASKSEKSVAASDLSQAKKGTKKK